MKILKWILGLLAGLAGAIALFAGGKSKQKIKEIKKDIKKSEKKTKEIKKGISAAERTQENYKKTLKEMVKTKDLYEAKDVSADDADKFIKDFLKKRKKKNG